MLLLPSGSRLDGVKTENLHPPPPHYVGLAPVSGGELVTIGKRKNITAPADCPPETGGRAKRRGWIRTNGKLKGENAKLTLSTEKLSPIRIAVGTLRAASDNKNNIHPYPPAGYSPCPRGRVLERWEV